MKPSLTLATLAVASLFSLSALASVPDHHPVSFSCQATDDSEIAVAVEVKAYDPLDGAVTVVSPEATHTHALTSAGHEGDELHHLFFTFGTPQGEATVLVGTQGETLDGALLSPYGDHALTCQKL